MKTIKFGVIGGGSIFSPELVELIAKEIDSFKSVQISLMDTDKERLATVGRLCERIVKKYQVPITIDYADSYEEVVENSDFILIQFRIGGEDARIDDELLGKKYKIPFVETITVCGVATFLRTYYELETLATIINEKAPHAWVLNFANPAGIVAEALHELGVKNVIGVCNASTRLLQFLQTKLQYSDEDSLFMSWRGLNHLTAVDSILLNGQEFLSTLIEDLEDFETDRIPFEKKLIQEIGFLPNQYFQYYFRRNSIVEKLQKAEKVRSEIVKETNADLLAQYKDIDYVPEGLSKRGGSGYSKTVVEVIKSLVIGDNKIHYLVTRNNGAIKELHDDAFVECPCHVAKNLVVPLSGAPLPKVAASIIVPMKSYESMLIEAAIQRSRKLLYQSMMMNPLLCDHVLVTDLLKDILEHNKSYLPKEM